MPLNKMGNFSFSHAAQQDDLYKAMDAATIKQAFDSRGNELKTALNNLIDALATSAGAKNIGLESIAELSGSDVQTILVALKALVDKKANITDVLSKTALTSPTKGSSGADQIKATPIATSPDTVQGILEWLKNQMDSTVLGQIPDGAVTPQKLSFDPATQVELDVVSNDYAAHKADYTSHVPYGSASGTDAKTITLSPAPTALTAGMALSFKNVTANGAAVTLNVNGLGAKPVVKSGGSALSSGNLKAGGVYTVRYDGTSFILQGEGGSGTAVASDLLSGKTASTDAGDITGTMVDRGALTITPGTTDQIIPSGFHNGDGRVKGEPNLIAANILSGKSVFGVAGSLIQGKRWASGTTTASNYRLYVSGLNFFPKVIIAYTSVGNSYAIYESYTSNPYYNNYVNTRASNDSNYFNKSDATITSSSFDIRVSPTGLYSYFWIAFE